MIEFKEVMNFKEVPRFNEVGFISARQKKDMTHTHPIDYETITKYMKRTPEAIGILRAIVTDIISDGFTFQPINLDKRGSGKAKIEKGKKFCRDNRFKAEFASGLFEWLMFGNCALWMGDLVKESDYKEIAKKMSLLGGVEVKDVEVKSWMDEADFSKKFFKCAPWKTMHIDLTEDKTSIKQYRQILQMDQTLTFEPKEIIHGKFMQFDGKVYGFSPIEASMNVITTLSAIKDLHGNFFVNGGVPDWLFILPKEMAGSDNVVKLEETLQKYKTTAGRHGNLVFTGEVEPHQLNKFDADMEFRQLAIYYTGILALAFNMPLARVAAIIGGETSSNAAGTDLSEAGYWRSIANSQDYWEDLLNTQLFGPYFGLNIKFNRGYKNDEIKEAQRDAQQAEVLNTLLKMKAIKPEYVKVKMMIPDDYWTGKAEAVEESAGFGKPGMPGQAGKKDLKGTAGQAAAGQKKKEAKSAMERKEIEIKEFYNSVDVAYFDDLVQRWVKSSQTRKVNWFEKHGHYEMYIDTPDTSYVCKVPVAELSAVKKQDWLDAWGVHIKGLVDNEGKGPEEKVAELARLDKKAATLKKTNQYLSERRDELIGSISSTKDELTILKDKKKQTMDKLGTMANKVDSALNDKLKAFDDQTREAQTKLNMMIQNIGKTEKDVQTLEAERKKKEAELQTAVDKVKKEQEKVTELQSAVKKLKGKI